MTTQSFITAVVKRRCQCQCIGEIAIANNSNHGPDYVTVTVCGCAPAATPTMPSQK